MKNIAIILSVYKTAELTFLKYALDSIKNQTYKNIKLFICIDGPVSSDIYKLIYNYDFDKKVIKHDYALGLAQSLNDLIQHVLDDHVFFAYIARMDEDDISRPDRIEKQIIFMDNNLGIIASGSSIITIDNKNIKGKLRQSETNFFRIVEKFGYKTPIFHPTAIFRSSLFKRGMKYNTLTSVPEDLYLWGELIKKGYLLGNLPDVLLEYRVSDKTGISRLKLFGCLNLFLFRVQVMRKYGKNSFSNTFLSICRFLISFFPQSVKIFLYRYYS